MRIRHSGKVRFFENRRSESRFSEDHDPCGRLQKVRAGARADHKKEGILHLAMKPYDARQAAEDFMLAPLLEDRGLGTPVGRVDLRKDSHAALAASIRARRSFLRN